MYKHDYGDIIEVKRLHNNTVIEQAYYMITEIGLRQDLLDFGNLVTTYTLENFCDDEDSLRTSMLSDSYTQYKNLTQGGRYDKAYREKETQNRATSS